MRTRRPWTRWAALAATTVVIALSVGGGCTTTSRRGTTPTETEIPTITPTPTITLTPTITPSPTPPYFLLSFAGENPYGYATPVLRSQLLAGQVPGPFATFGPIPQGVHSPAMAFDGANSVFLVGGMGRRTAVMCGSILPGPTTSWTLGSPVPTPVEWSQAAVTSDYLYSIGGFVANASGVPVITEDVWFAPVSAGTVAGPWSATTPHPTGFAFGYSWAADGHVYACGGLRTPSSLNYATHSAQILPSGHLSAWNTTASITAAGGSAYGGCVVRGDKAYLVGGFGYPGGSAGGAATLIGQMDGAGGIASWTAGARISTPSSLKWFGATSTPSHLWALGGEYSPSYVRSSTIYRAEITGATIGPWVSAGTLPWTVAGNRAVAHQ